MRCLQEEFLWKWSANFPRKITEMTNQYALLLRGDWCSLFPYCRETTVPIGKKGAVCTKCKMNYHKECSGESIEYCMYCEMIDKGTIKEDKNLTDKRQWMQFVMAHQRYVMHKSDPVKYAEIMAKDGHWGNFQGIVDPPGVDPPIYVNAWTKDCQYLKNRKRPGHLDEKQTTQSGAFEVLANDPDISFAQAAVSAFPEGENCNLFKSGDRVHLLDNDDAFINVVVDFKKVDHSIIGGCSYRVAVVLPDGSCGTVWDEVPKQRLYSTMMGDWRGSFNAKQHMRKEQMRVIQNLQQK